MYNFDEIIERRGTGSFKWDSAAEDVLPMWVADMDFAVAPCIQRAIAKRAEHPIFGYVNVPQLYYDTVINWYARRHHWTIASESIIYTSGVVPAVSAILQAVVQPGEKVIVQTPAYNCFFSSIRNAGAEVLPNPLHRIDIDDNTFTYEIDFETLETACSEESARVMIMCNPHNPSGRCWTREELLRVAEICRRNDVIVISDEIHNEITEPSSSYTPWGSLGKDYQDNVAICVSASKSFNIAGLQMANIIISNPQLRRRVNKRININETCDVGSFGYIAAIAAFSDEGAEWLEAMRRYVWDNYYVFQDFIKSNLPQLSVARLEATYLVWVDVTSVVTSSAEFEKKLFERHSLWVNSGEHYGECYEAGGRKYLRFNLACPRQLMMIGLQRLAKALS